MVADDRFGNLAEGSQGAISLQISGGPQRVRTADLRRANPSMNLLRGVVGQLLLRYADCRPAQVDGLMQGNL